MSGVDGPPTVASAPGDAVFSLRVSAFGDCLLVTAAVPSGVVSIALALGVACRVPRVSASVAPGEGSLGLGLSRKLLVVSGGVGCARVALGPDGVAGLALWAVVGPLRDSVSAGSAVVRPGAGVGHSPGRGSLV